MEPLEMTLAEYLDSLTDRNWHTLRHLIEMERNQLTEDEAREAHAIYLTAIDKHNALKEIAWRKGREAVTKPL